MFVRSVLLVLLFVFSCTSFAVDYKEGDIHAIDFHWFQTNLYHGVDQRGGPFKFTDSYLELEFGGRSGIVDYYGYVDFLDVLNDSNSERHEKANSFAKLAFRFSFDAMLKKDLAVGAVKEWYFATEFMNSDSENHWDPTRENRALRVLWLGLGTDTELPWLGLVGLNFQTRYIIENYGASNEESFDGLVFHMNWFKSVYSFGDDFIAFQGYLDYEFLSSLGDDTGINGENFGRTDHSFQTYLGFWYHTKRYALGYGAKFYVNMTQFKHDINFFGNQTDTTGVAHYFNVTYKF